MLSPQEVLMRDPTGWHWLLLAMILMGIVALVFKQYVLRLFPARRSGESGAPISIARRPILTPNEMAFFHALQRATGEQYVIFPQLPLATFVEGRVQTLSAQTSFMNQIDRKRVDFVLVDPQDLRLHLAIEVDDRSHESERRRQRDGLVEDVLQRAGITLVRIPAAHSYDVATLRRQLGLRDDHSGPLKNAASF